MPMPYSAAVALILVLQPVGIAAAQPALSAAAPAQTPSAVRCLAISAVLARTTDDNVKQAAMMMALYYLGKIDGSEPGADLKAQLVAEARTLNGADAAAIARTCSERLKVRGEALQSIGEAIKQEHPAGK